ncbi:uncharacterized protein VTP21DRAFT_5166 [Calcarisporiella thermophila]|uniref:uncharacterized protein n=1 Tax=Calcarisporiella thermophila TaxID=911321 RepID=UPI0037424DC7
MTSEDLFVAFDLSTQSLKCTVVNSNLQIILEESVNFDKDLPEFNTKHGAHHRNDRTTSPTLMWVKALDMLLERLQKDDFKFENVKSISGAAQQHGSVYWKEGASTTLSSLDSSSLLSTQLANAFSIADSPIWQDTSTTQQCRDLEAAVGGPERLADITGSRAFERFTASQIMKLSQRGALKDTERISLVSSFLASLFLGSYAPIESGDASGMNLMRLETREWDPNLLSICGNAKELELKLGMIAKDATKPIGIVSKYMQKRYGFVEECLVFPFTGDNPATVLAMGLKSRDLVVSLGTSDTLLAVVERNRTNAHPEAHLLSHPLDHNLIVAMVCFKNGSLAREYVRDKYAQKNWDRFNDLVMSTPPGCGDSHEKKTRNGFYYFMPEIVPFARGVHRFEDGLRVIEFTDRDCNPRAVLEAQFLSMRVRIRRLFQNSAERVIVVGGASANTVILQVLADVLQLKVYRHRGQNSASAGAARLARDGYISTKIKPIEETDEELILAAEPNTALAELYQEMEAQFVLLESTVVSASG